MLDEAQLLALLADLESFRVERTISTADTVKFSQAICAFANDMHNARLPGFLCIGADDKTGMPSGLKVTDELLRNLAGLTADGNILPPPAITVYRHTLSSGAGDKSSWRPTRTALDNGNTPSSISMKYWILLSPHNRLVQVSRSNSVSREILLPISQTRYWIMMMDILLMRLILQKHSMMWP